MSDRNSDKPTIIQTSSGGGWAAAIVAAVIVAAVAVYMLSDGKLPGSETVNINVEAPKVEAPAVPETPAEKIAPSKPAVPATNP